MNRLRPTRPLPSVPRVLPWLAGALGALAAATTLAPAGQAATAGGQRAAGPVPAVNRWAGPDGTSSMHGDSGASDTTPYAGPGAQAGAPVAVPLGGVCPTILAGADGLPQALCTGYVDRAPTVHLLDPATGAPLASLTLTAGSLLGGVYAYVDHRDRLVTADGTGAILFVAHRETATGWELVVDDRVDLTRALAEACGSPDCDAVATVAPGYDGRVWFATSAGRVGYADPREDRVEIARLGRGEAVANSIATSPVGTAIVTDHAAYLVRADPAGRVRTVWRTAYARGLARKPGQLSHGSGATPTFLGPDGGADWVALTDNARPRMHLLVLDARDGSTVCSVPLLGADNSGTENSPVGWGRDVYVASTYGYPYPAGTTGESRPASAPFVGGMEKVRVGRDGCRRVWTNDVASAAVPRYSRAERVLYTVERGASGSTWSLVRLDPTNGAVLSSSPLGVGPGSDTLQMVGSILPDGTLYQGTVTGLVRVPPA